jgi:hypothetical protein
MRISRWAAAAAAALLAGGLGIAGAPPASAANYSIDACDLEIGGHYVLNGDGVIVVVPDGTECGLNVFNATDVMIGFPVGGHVICYAYTFEASTYALGTGGAIGVHISTASFATLGDSPQTACGGASAGGAVDWIPATELELTKDLCKTGVWKVLGFKNQGQCIASLQANEHSGKS